MPPILSVPVRADVTQYKKAMREATQSTEALVRAGVGLRNAGAGIASIGDTLTRRVTLPLGLAGAAAIKMASDFDAAFVKATTLANVSAGEVDHLKESVLDLAGETGKAPQELAEALYFLSSSGLDADASMQALEASAKASAVGLGDTQVVANAVSGAMLAYAESGLTAAEATDVLIATARTGKAEPAELADQLGRLLPVATQLGVSFADLGGAFAVLSESGGPAEQQATQLLGVISSLVKPSKQAEEALKGVGLSVDGVRQMIAERGLPETLMHLREQLGDSGFRLVFDDIRALTGALALTQGDFDKTIDKFEQVRESAGATENAFSKWAESMGAQNAQAFAQFQVALIQVGEVLAPIASDVLKFVGDIAKAFGDLPGPVQNAILAFAGFAAALGPIMSVGGRLIQVIGSLILLFKNPALASMKIAESLKISTSAASGLTRALGFGGVAGALVAVGSGFALFLRQQNQANFAKAAEDFARLEKVTRDNVAATGLLNDAVKVSTTNFTASASAATTFAESGELTKQGLEDISAGFDSVLEKAPALAEEYIRNAEAAGVPAEKIREWRAALEEKIGADAAAAEAQTEYNAAVEEAAGVTQSATEAAQEYLDTVRGMFDPQFAMIDALQQSAAAQTELRDATAALAEARAGGDVEAIAEAEARYAEAVNGARTSVVDLHGAAVTLKASMAESGQTADQVTAQFIDLATQQGFTREEAVLMAGAFGLATGAADTLGATDPNVRVTETGTSSTRTALTRTRDAAHSIPSSKNTHTSTSGTGSAAGSLFSVRDAANSIPRSVTTTITTILRTVTQTFGGSLFGGRQHGGPVLAGQAYVVGEAGPELLVMGNDSGTVIPNHAFQGAPSGGVGFAGGGYIDNRTINITTGADPQSVVAALRRAGDMGLPITIRGRRL